MDCAQLAIPSAEDHKTEVKMTGTKAGAKKAVAAIKQKYGEDWYARIGQKGGKVLGPRRAKKQKIEDKIAGANGGRLELKHGGKEKE